jgi:hypothetical protein
MRHLHLHGHGDPFTLLHILQAVRDLAAGEQIEIRSERAEPLAELLRLLPADRCRAEEVAEAGQAPGRRLLVTAGGAATTRRDGADNPNPMEKNP